MLFGNDGKLYITVGDSGTQGNGEDMRTVHGKLIRLNDDGSVPSDNPFTSDNGYDAYHCRQSEGKVPADAPDGAVCAEIYANGLRNPFRVAVNPNVQNKTLFAISDVGARVWEELSYAGTDFAGVNYGYPLYEGPCIRHSDTDCPIPDDPTFLDPFQ
jgi:aldose sugar dehydrogenase